TTHKPPIETDRLSAVLDRLINKTTYDKRLRPMYGSSPVDVGITIHVSSISAVSEVDMDFTLDFYMRQTWKDPRLAFQDSNVDGNKIGSLTVGVDYLDKLWKPDTFFPNEKKSFFHTATTHNSFLRIDPDGTVFTSQRLTVTATCPMKLQLFPMDSQRCRLEIESYGYAVKDINYHFIEKVKNENFTLPQFQLLEVSNATRVEELSSGKYVRLIAFFLFKRSIGFYIIQIYLPSILIVVISWVSFWLSRDATPARIGLGVTTVLTMTTLMTTTNAAMPKVSYVKSIDIFLGVSFLMVFASLVEYAAVGYITKRHKLIVKRKQSRALSIAPQSPDLPHQRSVSVPAYYNTAYRPFYSSTDRSSNLYIDSNTRPPIAVTGQLDRPCLCPPSIPDVTTPLLSVPKSTRALSMSRESVVVFDMERIEEEDENPRGSRLPPRLIRYATRIKRAFRPSNIDKHSRSIFPTINKHGPSHIALSHPSSLFLHGVPTVSLVSAPFLNRRLRWVHSGGDRLLLGEDEGRREETRGSCIRHFHPPSVQHYSIPRQFIRSCHLFRSIRPSVRGGSPRKEHGILLDEHRHSFHAHRNHLMGLILAQSRGKSSKSGIGGDYCAYHDHSHHNHQ
ncbi:hypothetical protein PMAYCL1PPCAC_12253, partial [Pristionchus mayeri]